MGFSLREEQIPFILSNPNLLFNFLCIETHYWNIIASKISELNIWWKTPNSAQMPSYPDYRSVCSFTNGEAAVQSKLTNQNQIRIERKNFSLKSDRNPLRSARLIRIHSGLPDSTDPGTFWVWVWVWLFCSPALSEQCHTFSIAPWTL
jgi:hypothetical protein